MKGISPTARANALSVVLMFLIFVFAGTNSLFANDLSEATQLRERCEAESKVLEIAVNNFGAPDDLKIFHDGIAMIKMGKVKFAQSKYLEAKAKYNEYLKLQSQIYKSVAELYIARTEQLHNDIAAELVDFIDNDKVGQYLKLTNQNLADAKSSMSREAYKIAIDHCRTAKKYALDCYKVLKKEVPENYKKDLTDINKEIYKSAPAKP
jgi:hypothetical protein